MINMLLTTASIDTSIAVASSTWHYIAAFRINENSILYIYIAPMLRHIHYTYNFNKLQCNIGYRGHHCRYDITIASPYQ